jgi:hypothetical protein
MALTKEKIAKLRELADRGIGGEKDNARRMLEKNGIDWRKPKEQEKAQSSNQTNYNYKVAPIRNYFIEIGHVSDVLLVAILLSKFCPNNNNFRIDENKIRITTTEKDYQKIIDVISKKSQYFDSQMIKYAKIELATIF